MDSTPFAASACIAALLSLVSAGCKSTGSVGTNSRTNESLFVATPLTAEGLFTKGIEGPACDRDGNVYAVDFAREQTIGKVTPAGKAELFVELPGKSNGNGIVFEKDGTMFVADYAQHNVLQINSRTRSISVLAHDDRMNQPNDLAMAPDGT